MSKTTFTIEDFTKHSQEQHKIAMLTAYDYHSARLAEAAGINALLVGDSLGMVIHGNATTMAVTLDEIIYHTRLVRQGAPNTFIVADMPYLSYHVDVADTIRNAGRIIKETQANAVKMEINHENTLAHIEGLIAAQIPVMGHVGLTPQSINIFGGFKMQGKQHDEAEKILKFAQVSERIGCFSLVLECIPQELAARITKTIKIATIGIGSGNDCTGQILVMQDMLGIHNGFVPKFVKQYLHGNELITNAFKQFIDDVNAGT